MRLSFVRAMSLSYYRPFIKGQQIVEGSGTEIKIINPANGSHLYTVISASEQDISSAINTAQDVFKSGIWSCAPSLQRSIVLTKIARKLEEHVPELARIETMQTGRTLREMSTQLGRLPEWLDYYAALLRTQQGFVAPTQGELLNYVTRIPLGVVAQITPFNHPLLIALKKIAPALAAGNSIIVKPSELAPVSVIKFAELATEAGLPPGVLSVLPGDGQSVGKMIVSNPLIKKVDITAGTKAGRELGSIVGSNLALYTAELGGKAPVIVFNEAELQAAVNGVAFASFIASGQTCVSATRLIIQNGIYDKFMPMFLDKIASITRRIGNPLNPKSSMGSVISDRHLNRITAMLKQSKGEIIVGGKRMSGLSPLDDFNLSGGSFFPPTVVSKIGTDDILWIEEIFGPVVVTKKFETEGEAIEIANDCKYGLGAGIWTNDLSQAHRVAAKIEAGLVWINTHHRNDPSSPWGGMKESGIGRENGIEAFHSYSQSKSTIVNIGNLSESRMADDWFSESTEPKRYG